MAGLFMPMRPKVDPVPPLPPIGKSPVSINNARGRLWDALDRLCGICGSGIEALDEVTYDHVVPRSKGGGNYGNLVPAHSRCNGEKGDRLPYGCELIMLDALNTKAGNVVAEIYAAAAPNPTMAAAFAKIGVIA